MFTTFSQQIISDKLLLAVTNKQKSNFSSGLILELVITCHL